MASRPIFHYRSGTTHRHDGEITAGQDFPRALARQREAIEAREGVRQPARTTISDEIQIVTRALGLLAEIVVGVPDLTDTAMPPTSPSRERCAREGEPEVLLGCGNDLQPTAIELRVETTLLCGRLLEPAHRHLVKVGGRTVVMVSRDELRRKRTGTIPLTPAICSALERSVQASDQAGRDPDGL